MKAPLVSVIMPTYNRARLVGRAIDSVLCQTMTDFELIIIDDASTDATWEILNRYEDPRVRLVRREENHLKQHHQKGTLDNPRNDGLRVARGKYISYLDDDDMYRPRFLEVMTSYLTAHPEVGLAYCDYVYHRKDRVNRRELASCHLSRDFDPEMMKKTNLISTVVAMHRKSIVSKIGFWVPNKKKNPYPGVPYAGSTDWDYFFRVSQHFAVKHLPIILVDVVHQSSRNYRKRDFVPQDSLAIVTPSYISNQKRAGFALRAFTSLRKTVGIEYLHIVIDSSPGEAAPWRNRVSEIYSKPNVRLIHHPARLISAVALYKSVCEAFKMGVELCFIHLDDSVYVPELRRLLQCSRLAFERDSELSQIRLTGYPIINKSCNSALGNVTRLSLGPEEVSFPRVRLKPTRHQECTVWWVRFQDGVIGGRIYPIVLWLTVFRTEILRDLLHRALKLGHVSLSSVETYYIGRKHWSEEWLRTKLGFINMQFGGFEVHRNANWREILAFPNTEVR